VECGSHREARLLSTILRYGRKDRQMSEQKRKDRCPEGLKHEYDQVNEYIRHYSNLRFAVFTVFVALTAAIGYVALSAKDFDTSAKPWAEGAGLLLTLAFFLFDERISQMFEHFSSRAIKLEKDYLTDYEQIQQRPPGYRWVPPAQCVMRAIFAATAIFWLIRLVVYR
jgi:DNA-binding ferritin-like protein (Dps family)